MCSYISGAWNRPCHSVSSSLLVSLKFGLAPVSCVDLIQSQSGGTTELIYSYPDDPIVWSALITETYFLHLFLTI